MQSQTIFSVSAIVHLLYIRWKEVENKIHVNKILPGNMFYVGITDTEFLIECTVQANLSSHIHKQIS